MARKRKEGIESFPHDTDAATDEKVKNLRNMYGAEGYAFYFYQLEEIYKADPFELDISTEDKIGVIADKIGISYSRYVQILMAALDKGLFDKDMYLTKGVLTSHGIKKRAERILREREQSRRRVGKSRKEKIVTRNNKIVTRNNSDDIPKPAKAKGSEVLKKTTAPDVAPIYNNNINNNINNIYSGQFVKFWELYPRKEDKGDAYKQWQARMKEGVKPDDMIKACEIYAQKCKKSQKDKEYIKLPKTFLAKTRPFESYLSSELDKPLSYERFNISEYD